MVIMKDFIFFDGMSLFIDDSSWVGHITEVSSKIDLLKQISFSLKFPEYFGLNWDALYDCLRDFHWLSQHRIIIVHDDIPHLDDQALNIYISVLYDAINDWKEGEEHELDVVFPKQYEQKIESLITRKNL
jgi:RNAse (barnase) inhibitor barstar